MASSHEERKDDSSSRTERESRYSRIKSDAITPSCTEEEFNSIVLFPLTALMTLSSNSETDEVVTRADRSLDYASLNDYIAIRRNRDKIIIPRIPIVELASQKVPELDISGIFISVHIYTLGLGNKRLNPYQVRKKHRSWP